MYSGSDEMEEREELGEGQEVGQEDRQEEVEHVEGKKEEVEEGEEQEDKEGKVEAVDGAQRQDPISISHSSSVYASCVSEMDALEPHSHLGQSAGIVRGELETSTTSNRTLTTEHAQYRHTEVENGLTGQLQAPRPVKHVHIHATNPSSPQKFNNLLDKCNAEESDIVKPKPRLSTNPNPPLPQQRIFPAHHQPPGITVADPQAKVTRPEAVSSTDITLGGDMHQQQTTSPELSPSPLGELPEDPGPLQSFLFPVSNSPMDIICMLSRLASFTGELLAVLTPKIRKTNYNKVRSGHFE